MLCSVIEHGYDTISFSNCTKELGLCLVLLYCSKQWGCTKAVNNGAVSDIKHANSKNDANSKKQNTALKKTLNIYSLNINGLLSYIDELRVFIDDHMPDIICINETKTDDKIHDSDIEVDNYLLLRKDRNSDGGGVAIYVLKDLEFAVRNDLMVYNLENVTIQLKIGN